MKTTMLLAVTLLTTATAYSQIDVDELKIRSAIEIMATSWTNGDGEGFASVFADEHNFFVWNGIYFPDNSREANAKNHQFIFNTVYKDTKHYFTVDKIRFITDDVAIALVMSAVAPKTEPRPQDPAVLWSATFSKVDDEWKIVSFHNADIAILQDEKLKDVAPMPKEVMFKNW